MVLSDEEKKKKREYDREYRSRPEVKAKKREYAIKTQKNNQRPEVKAKKREYDREYRSRPERREYRSRPEVKAKKKEYFSRPEVKAKKKEYGQRPEVKAKKKEYGQRPEVKAKKKEYGQRPEVKAKKKEYGQRPEVKAKKRKATNRYRKDLKLEVYSVYSKRQSNSEIPCCRCCGENSYIEFLTVDHIGGREHLSKKEKDLTGRDLNNWLKRNDYPDNFQILCWNCNMTKGNFGQCPHKE